MDNYWQQRNARAIRAVRWTLAGLLTAVVLTYWMLRFAGIS